METTSLPRRICPGEIVYQDKYQRLYRIPVEFDGFTKEYFVSDRGERAAILVVREAEVLLVRQYRLLINGLSLEIPGGRVDEGETPEEAAVRECLEETGMRCHDLKPLISYHPSVDVWRNYTYIYYSENCSEEIGATREVLGRRVWIPLPRCVDMVQSGKIVDSLSIIAILSYHALESRR
jgi:8-oxo-dGTP pyrophosphatase MutT (NUDIX family)